MSENTKIEWCDATFNPWQGCEKVSPACKNCYAEAIVNRFGNDFANRRRTGEENWKQPLKWDRWCRNNGVRKRVFSLSMGDWLDDEVPIEWLADFLRLIDETPHLDWLLLTKRPENWRRRLLESAARMLRDVGEEGDSFTDEAYSSVQSWLRGYAPRNVWIGTTVEDQARADERIPELLRIPARIRFLSCEPLLGEVDLNSNLGGTRWMGGRRGCMGLHHGRGTPDCPRELHHHHDERCKPGIDWVICGGESGPKARPMHPDWARSLRDQCQAADVPFFFKQWGEWLPAGHFGTFASYDHPLFKGKVEFRDPHYRVGKRHAGRLLDGREWSEFPTLEKPTPQR